MLADGARDSVLLSPNNKRSRAISAIPKPKFEERHRLYAKIDNHCGASTKTSWPSPNVTRPKMYRLQVFSPRMLSETECASCAMTLALIIYTNACRKRARVENNDTHPIANLQR